MTRSSILGRLGIRDATDFEIEHSRGDGGRWRVKIGRIDYGGAVTHITWYVRHLCDGKTSRVSALRLIVPTDMLPTIARQFANPANADTVIDGVWSVDAEDAPSVLN
jgi:hypothetical protein